MLLTCPHCTTIFRVDAELIPPDGRTVRCSICHNIWIVLLAQSSANQPIVQSKDGGGVARLLLWPVTTLSVARNWLKQLLKPCFLAVLVASLAGVVIMCRGMITAYLPSLINGFDHIGLSVRPAVAQLQVVGLSATYIGDTMRISGKLRNIGMWRTHAANLRVTVRGADGKIMREKMIRPDDDIIDSQAESGFFVQLVVEAGREAHVTVTPLANSVYRSGALNSAKLKFATPRAPS